MTPARIASVIVAIVVVAIVIGFIMARSGDSSRPGQPAPHAIDQSQ